MENKVYFISGASSDVGKKFIYELNKSLNEKQDKATVIAHYSNNKLQLEEMVQGLSNVNLCLVQTDLTKSENIDKMIDDVKKICECPDYIIHLPAVKLTYSKVKSLSWNRMQNDLEIQVHTLAEIGKSFLPLMSKRGNGKIVVMLSSVTLGMPPKYMTEYVTVKYALLGMMKSFASEYAGKGICINGISPNMMETQFINQIDDRIVEMNKLNCCMKRNVKVEETVSAIQYLLSEGANYMNGVNLNLSGGDK